MSLSNRAVLPLRTHWRLWPATETHLPGGARPGQRPAEVAQGCRGKARRSCAPGAIAVTPISSRSRRGGRPLALCRGMVANPMPGRLAWGDTTWQQTITCTWFLALAREPVRGTSRPPTERVCARRRLGTTVPCRWKRSRWNDSPRRALGPLLTPPITAWPTAPCHRRGRGSPAGLNPDAQQQVAGGRGRSLALPGHANHGSRAHARGKGNLQPPLLVRHPSALARFAAAAREPPATSALGTDIPHAQGKLGPAALKSFLWRDGQLDFNILRAEPIGLGTLAGACGESSPA